MTEPEKLRALLAEAREFLVPMFHDGCEEGGCDACRARGLDQRIDAALEEKPTTIHKAMVVREWDHTYGNGESVRLKSWAALCGSTDSPAHTDVTEVTCGACLAKMKGKP